MAIDYSNLINVSGEIRTKDQTRAFKDPTDLAGYLGIKAENIDWTKITPESLAPIESLSLPDKTTPISTAALDMTSGYKSTADLYAQQAADFQKSLEEARKEQETMKTAMEEYKPISTADLQKQLQEQYQLPAQFEQIKQLTSEANIIRDNLVNLTEARDQALLAQEGLPGFTMSEVAGRQAVIERQANSRIAAESARLSSKAAMIEAVQGNIETARTFVNEAVDAMVYDQKANYEYLTNIYDMNQDIFDGLDKKYQTAFQNALTAAEANYQEAREEASQIQELALSAATQYGITLDLTGVKSYDEAVKIYQERVAPIVRQQEAEAGKTTGGGAGGGSGEGGDIIPSGGADPEIDALAQAYLRGETLGSIGATKKAQVFQRADQIKASPEYKEQIKTELKGDIQEVINKNDYTNREDIINRLTPLYPELNLDEVAAEVYGMLPDQPEVSKSFWQRLFGK